MTTPYETLGVAADATAAQIKKAWRSLAQKNHPDKGGDKATMQAIQDAYDILSDPERRAKFDQTGSVEKEKSLRDIALGQLPGLIEFVLSKYDPDEVNILELMAKQCDANAEAMDGEIAKQVKGIRACEVALSRLKAKNGVTIMHGILQARTAALREHEVGMRKHRQMLDELKLLLDDYTYELPEPKAGSRRRLNPDDELAEAITRAFGRFGSGSNF